MKLVDTVLLAFADKMEAVFNVACLAGAFASMSKRSMHLRAVTIVAEQAAIYLASEVDMATGVGIVEFASMRAPLWKII